MIKVKRILKDYDESGALNTLVNIHATVAENVFLTKSADLVMLLALRGVDPECLDHCQKDQIARRFESALRIFDERFRVYPNDVVLLMASNGIGILHRKTGWSSFPHTMNNGCE